MKSSRRTFKEKIINVLLWVFNVAIFLMTLGLIAFKMWLEISWKLSIIGLK